MVYIGLNGFKTRMVIYVAVVYREGKIDRIIVTPFYEKVRELEIIARFDKFCEAINFAYEIAEKYEAIVEWDIVYFILRRGDRALLTWRPEDCTWGEELRNYVRYSDAFADLHSLADVMDLLIEWYIEDEWLETLCTTLVKPIVYKLVEKPRKPVY